VRYDTRMEFDDPAAWKAYNSNPTNGVGAAGFKSGAFDGKYIYFAVRDCDSFF